ncbi:MAG: hypothetical protein KDA92_22145, partial [Planctomycetales bacterium]|nr:hypothetical protein [Planctomycetales bacterium]
QAGEYEDSVEGNSRWSEGDWNCDGDFNSSDLVRAFQTGAYSVDSVAGPARAAVSSTAVDDALIAAAMSGRGEKKIAAENADAVFAGA